MLRILGCLVTEHDYPLLVLAGLVCALSGFTTFSLLARASAARRRGRPKRRWPLFAGMAAGIGAWSTHFIAMLAFDPGLPTGFDLGWTAATAALCTIGAVAGMATWTWAEGPAGRILGGLVVGCAVAVMHYAGMAAIQLPGRLEYNPALVTLSVVLGTLVISSAFFGAPPAARSSAFWQLRSILAFMSGVVVLHFTGMGALTVVPDGNFAVTTLILDHRWAAALIASITGLGLVGGVTSLLIEARMTVRAEQAEAQMLHLVHHDPLTNLVNRGRLERRLAEAVGRARRSSTGFAVCCVDLDRFKAFNDLFGHAAGDQLLRGVAERLLGTVRECDTVARNGGDEFIIIQENIGGLRDVEVLARRVLEQLGQPVKIAGKDVNVSASIGIAIYPTDGVEPEVLLANADLALQRVKDWGRNGHAFFRPDMEEGLRERRALEHDLSLALERGELWLAWQPQLDIASNRVVGFETLLRWQHPTRGLVPPSEFIPLAEASGAIIRIGAWVLRTACLEAAGWQQKLRVSVNVSPMQVQQDGFAAMIGSALAESGLDPVRLELEVTESLLIHDPVRALEALRAVKDMGAAIAMDDFGTGYSSLSTLRAFPFDRLKIDRSFISDLQENAQAAAIVHAIIGLGQGLGMPIVAEGVETRQQLESLARHDCTEAQGYLIGRPSRIATFAALTSATVPPLRSIAELAATS